MTPDEFPLFYQWAVASDATPFWYGIRCGDEIPDLNTFSQDWKPHYFDGSSPNQGRCFIILHDDIPIGQVNYNKIDESDNSVELDIIIADRSDWNKGFGTDALKTLSSFLFQNMNVQRCFIEVLENNPRALKAYEKSEFKVSKRFVRNGVKMMMLELKREQL